MRQRIISLIKTRWKHLSAFIAVLLTVYYFCLPQTLFDKPYSTVLLDRKGNLLGARIADDGQWRFPGLENVPENFATALVTFEDQRFYRHPGVDILSIGRAIQQNWKTGRVVSGGSTLSMQLIRLSRGQKGRTITEKIIEIILASRLEFRYSKDEILALYASHAPFGSNVVGLDAACWRYFGTDAKQLSWGQAAFLAVLPNAPSMIHPGRNRALLRDKRDRLLDKLVAAGKIDQLTCDLAKAEMIPEAPQSLPTTAPHLLARLEKDGHKGKRIVSTVDVTLQQRVVQLVHEHHLRLQANEIHNAAAIVVELASGNVVAYVGNVSNETEHENFVDVLNAPRSTGSILKPFLHAAMMDEGKILPETLLPDVPVLLNGFSPKNFSLRYDGAVPARGALVRSLNVPYVNLLSDYRYEKFHTLLQRMGMTTLTRPPDHYGLSLILGGAEGTLWDITGMYASMGRVLQNYFKHPGANRYVKHDFHAPIYIPNRDSTANVQRERDSYLSAASIYLTFESMQELSRPGEQTGWKHFQSSKKIAWKTGTSFGFRDGWAVGVTGSHVVGVWVGNADGEGRPGLTGTDAAAPLMFDIFSLLPVAPWFEKPFMEMEKVVTCSKSGYRAALSCNDTDTVFINKAGLQSKVCPFHKKIHLSGDEKFRVHDQCYNVDWIRHVSWFVLPAVQEYYFKQLNSWYKPLPQFLPGCISAQSGIVMEMVYPRENGKLFIPKQLDGKASSSVFQLVHRNPGATVYWHLDGSYLGSTQTKHSFQINTTVGKHKLTVVDEDGETIERIFEVSTSL